MGMHSSSGESDTCCDICTAISVLRQLATAFHQGSTDKSHLN